tara:strand:+ start:2521 stop:2760 length:240 start_codon:yes stop_codon:yes gene_type:complete
MKYKLSIKEEESDIKKFHQSRIKAFSEIEDRLETLKKSLRLAKIDTTKYYRDNPTSYGVVYGTDLIGDYLNDMETLLQQ